MDLGELVAHAADDTRVTAPDRDVLVCADQPAVTVLGDPDQLGQLLANLMRNAVLHTPAGTPMEIGVRHDGSVARLRVRDHGPGVPDGAGNQLFDRFWRTEGGRSRGKGGAGLGLAIVKAIAEAHGGAVSAENAPGGGALFEVSLPAHPRFPEPSQQSLSLLTSDSYLNHPD